MEVDVPRSSHRRKGQRRLRARRLVAEDWGFIEVCLGGAECGCGETAGPRGAPRSGVRGHAVYRVAPETLGAVEGAQEQPEG